MGRLTLTFVLVFILLQQSLLASSSRQKRCIVIQKQSGTHGDSSEGGEEDRDVEPRKPGKRSEDRHDRRNVEKMSPDAEFLRYKIGPARKLDDIIRYKNKLTSFKNRYLRNIENTKYSNMHIA